MARLISIFDLLSAAGYVFPFIYKLFAIFKIKLFVYIEN